MNNLLTDVSLHPGEVLRDELEARDISQKVFAERLGMHPSHLNEMLAGKRNLSAKTAFKLEKHLGIEAMVWLRLQANHDIFIAKKDLHNEI